jgi:hypothetical protein
VIRQSVDLSDVFVNGIILPCDAYNNKSQGFAAGGQAACAAVPKPTTASANNSRFDPDEKGCVNGGGCG